MKTPESVLKGKEMTFLYSFMLDEKCDGWSRSSVLDHKMALRRKVKSIAEKQTEEA
jgi:hypothetical protein